MIYITGDTHNTIDIKKLGDISFKEGYSLTKSDYLIVCGDFGVLWNNIPDKNENYLVNFYNTRPWVTLFIDGNHENFYRLEKLPKIEMFGNIVGKISDSIYHLKRGHVYTINGKTFWVMGGAESIDKADRKEHITWWKQELPNNEEYEFGLQSLEKVWFSVDYIVTHTCPESFFYDLNTVFDLKYKDGFEKQLRQYLQIILEKTKFKKWYFGHFHDDIAIKNFQLLFNVVTKIED